MVNWERENINIPYVGEKLAKISSQTDENSVSFCHRSYQYMYFNWTLKHKEESNRWIWDKNCISRDWCDQWVENTTL